MTTDSIQKSLLQIEEFVSSLSKPSKKYNLLQLQVLLFQIDLIDLVNQPDLEGERASKVVDLLEQSLAIYDKISKLDGASIDPLYTRGEVEEVEAKYNEMISSISSTLFNQPPGQA